MRKHKKLKSIYYFTRFAVVLLSIFFQTASGIFLAVYFSDTYFYIKIVLTLLSVITLFLVLNKEQGAVYKLPWTALFCLLPIVAIIIYLAFGKVKISKKQLAKYGKVLTYENEENIFPEELKTNYPDAYGQMKYITNVTGLYPSVSESEFLNSGREFYTSLVKAIESAEKYVFMEYFIIEEGVMLGGILQALENAIGRGVKVYFIYDDVGSMAKVPMSYCKTLATKGINAVKFNSFKPKISIEHNNRNHRKITVVDGLVGYVGGINLADEYIGEKTPYGRWLDCAVRLEGKCVDNLVKLFVQDYNFSSQSPINVSNFISLHIPKKGNFYVLPFGDAPSPVINEHVGENVYLSIISSAKESVYIVTPYFVVDTNILNAMKVASIKGVDVRIILPGIADKKLVNLIAKSTYKSLISSGVKIYQYTGGFAHAKCVLADGEIAVIGSINFDYRSFVHHYECATYLYNGNCVNGLKEWFNALFLNDVVEITESNVSKYSLKWYEKILKDLIYIFAPLL